MKPVLNALRRRWNAVAYDLVNEELARVASENDRLVAENDELRRQLACAEECAAGWYEDAISALNKQANAVGGTVGLTKTGHLVVVPVPQGEQPQ